MSNRDGLRLLTLSQSHEPVEIVLRRALESLRDIVLYDMAVIFELEDGTLRVRAAAGPLATERVRQHRLDLAKVPTVRRALELRRPVAMLEDDHIEHGDPFDDVQPLPAGHACMVVPLFAGDRTLGAMTFDRSVCEPYTTNAVELAGVFGQLVALAIAHAEQTAVLQKNLRILHELARLEAADKTAGYDPAHALARLPSPAMQRLVRQARLVSETNVPVLVTGETGVGKELLARAVHSWSPRRDEAFVAVNCAAIPENLLESELFGHVRGAFTGASASRAGRFATADKGTLLLDEIGDLPLSAQSKLLRVLQEGTFEPVGSDRATKVDVRVIAATHVDLEEAVRRGKFREDLYFRLAVFPLPVPPLRERPEDVTPMALDMLAAIHRRSGRGPWTLPDATRDILKNETWPGNARQLHNALERATILVPHGSLPPSVFGFDTGPRPNRDADLTLEEVERRHITHVLERCHGKIYGERGAAKILGLKPSTLQSRMQKLGLRKGRDAELGP